MRIGECLSLLWETMVVDGKPVQTIILPSDVTKTKESREIPVSTRLYEALTDYLQYYNRQEDVTGRHYFFWTRSPACKISVRTIERIFEVTGLEVISRPVWPHLLRHTFATRLMRVSDIRTVQSILGHKCLSSTQVYTHPSNDDKKSAIDALQ